MARSDFKCPAVGARMLRCDAESSLRGLVCSFGRSCGLSHGLSGGFACVLLAGLSAGAASGQVRVAAWNISFYGGGRAADIQNITYGSFEGRSFAPDIIALQEFETAAALSEFVTILNAAPGSPGDWALAPFIDGPFPDNALVYRSGRFDLLATLQIADASTSTVDQPRSTYRYDLRPIGYNAPQTVLAVYPVHLKSGSTGDDNLSRLAETTRIRNNAAGMDTSAVNTANDGMPAGYNFVMGGDTNVQNSTQTGYQQLVASMANNTGRFFDPINSPGGWNNTLAYRFLHTQDPVGAGGMDDRHDQILISGSLRDSVGWHYIGSSTLAYSTTTWNDPNHSYRCWGNDGTSFNLAMTTTGNTMVGASIAQDLKDVCVGAGHLPVYADFRVPAKMGVSVATINFGVVQLGAAAPTVAFTVTNTGDTARFGANGIATLNYSLATVAPNFSVGALGPFVEPSGGTGNAHTATMFTAVAGVKNAMLTLTSDAPDQPTAIVSFTGIVNSPPIALAGADQTVTDTNNSGAETVTLSGALSGDPNPPVGTIASFEWKEGGVTIAGPGPSPTANVSLAVGVHTITLHVIDNHGGAAQDTVIVTVNAGAGVVCDSIDFNGDGVSPDSLDIEDYLSVYGGGPCSNDPNCGDIDFNNDGVSPDSLDIDTLLLVYGGGTCE